MELDDHILIDTPEGIELDLALAGLGSRMVAVSIDIAIRVALLFAYFFALGLVLSDETVEGSGFVIAGFFILVFFLIFGYDVVFETLGSGRTPGKRWTGLRVVREGGHPVGFLASAIRSALRIVDLTLPIIDFFSIFFTAKHQRLGDLAAGTIVIRERHAKLRAPRGRRARRAARHAPNLPTIDPEELAGWDVSTITTTELATVRQFLERRPTLTPEARHRLGWQLAQRLRPKVAGIPDDLHHETFLEGMAAAKSARM